MTALRTAMILSLTWRVLPAEEPGLYGPCADEQPEVRSVYADIDPEAWLGRPFAVVRSQLNPAWLVHSKTKEMRLFQGIEAPPAWIFYRGNDGTKAIKAGASLKGGQLAEPWLLASFAGVKGWERFDAPYLIVLQRRPTALDFTPKGLFLRFEAEAGLVACLPLYGYLKLPQKDCDFRKEHALPPLGIESWTWPEKGLPEEVLGRCRWWSRIVRAYPLTVRETFSVDCARETVTIRQDVRWLKTTDDWGTQPLRLHPLPPTLGLAYLNPGFPIRFSHEIHDPGYFTPFGPYLGALETDRLEMEFHVLQYINNIERPSFPACAVAQTLKALEAVLPKLSDKAKQQAEPLLGQLAQMVRPFDARPVFTALDEIEGKAKDERVKLILDEERRRLRESSQPFQEKLAQDALERVRKTLEHPDRTHVLVALRWLNEGVLQVPGRGQPEKAIDEQTLMHNVLQWLHQRVASPNKEKVAALLKRVKPLKPPAEVKMPDESAEDTETGGDLPGSQEKLTVKAVSAALQELKTEMVRPEQELACVALRQMYRPIPTRDVLEAAHRLFAKAGEELTDPEAKKICAEAERVLAGELQNTRNQIAWTCLSRIRAAMDGKFRNPEVYAYDHGGLGNFVWAVMGDIWYPKALPYVGPDRRQTACSSLRLYLAQTVLDKATYSPFRHKFILHGPGIGSWGGWDDAGKIATNVLQTVWAYAHHTGDWDLVRERWDIVKKLFITPEEMCWCFVGRAAIAEMGDEAPPCAALARMAWRVGDIDTYRFAAYCHAKEMVHHYVKSFGADYFVRHQPLNHWQPMRPPVFLTNLWGSTAGWQIDGPGFPKETAERQFTNRWVRFQCEDTARFYMDTPALREAVAREICDDVTGWLRFREQRAKDDSHILPSLIRVRSFILDENADKLASITPPERFGGYGSMLIAPMLAYLRATTSRQTVRIIPASGGPSPFLPGLERGEGRTGDGSLVQAMDWKKPWVNPVWFYWGTWFGTISPSESPKPKSSGGQWIGPATHVQWFEP